mmetsp:Transcript_1372/g.3491  ORF Transcript_1372/g.3491 Transcript_1372/m.3491 type:complete len:111 (-) Transcript_1372:145-477(-)
MPPSGIDTMLLPTPAAVAAASRYPCRIAENWSSVIQKRATMVTVIKGVGVVTGITFVAFASSGEVVGIGMVAVAAGVLDFDASLVEDEEEEDEDDEDELELWDEDEDEEL